MNNKLVDWVYQSIITAILTTITMMVFFAWITGEDNNVDENMVVIEYDCRDVIRSPSDFTQQVVNECRDKFKKTKTVQKQTV